MKCSSSLGIREHRDACPGAPVSILALLLSAFVALGAATPDGPWGRTTSAAQGLSGAKLEALRADLATRKTRAFLVIRNDAIVCEWYAPDHGANTQFGTASLAKAIVGGLSLAAAMTDGHLELDDPAAKFIPQWREDPRKSKITLRQLGSHTSGIEDAEANDTPHDQLAGWKGYFWKRLAVPNDPFTLARDRAPIVFEPGEKMQYSNPGIALMTWCVTASLRDAAQKDIRSLLRDRVMRPIGVTDAEWSVGYGQTFQVDGLQLVPSWGGGNYTARAAARVGRLMLRGGDWDGQRLLSVDAVRLTTSDAGTPGPGGMGWWSNQEGDCAKLPRDAFFGSGAGHQILLVVPSLNLIVVRFGGLLANVATDPKSYHEAYNQFLFEPLMSAISDLAPESTRSEGKAADMKTEPGWRPLPLIADGKIDTNWTQVGWGGFVVDDGALRTECHAKGLGLLFYGKERFGNCQIRVVFRSKDAKSNAGVFVRIPDGIQEQVGQPGAAFDRGADGKISSFSMKKIWNLGRAT